MWKEKTHTQEKISDEEILEQVDRVCAASAFRRSEKLCSFLKFIVDEYIKKKADSLKAYTIAVSVFNRPDHFDAQTDSIVRVYGGKLRRELKNYYLTSGKNDPIFITIPKGRYAPKIKPREKLNENYSQSSLTVSTAVSNAVKANPAIAVILFDCLEENKKFQYLSSGITEEIIIGLGSFPELHVIGPLYREIIREKGLDKRGIGLNYKVRFVLEGAVRIKNQKLILTARLNDAQNGHQLWGKVMESDIHDVHISEFENKVISHIVSTIADNYGVISRVLRKESFAQPTDNPSVYEAILRYYHHFIVLTAESMIDAIDHLEKAIKKEPKNALTLAMLGDLVISNYQFGYSDSLSLLERAEQLGRKAVALDPNCQTARFMKGVVYFLRAKGDLAKSEFDIALQLNPNNAHYIAAISLHLAMMGDWDRGVELMDKACRMNPHYPGWHHLVYFMDYYRQGKYEEALLEANRFNTPEYYMDPFIRATVLGQLNRKKEAKKAVNELLSLVPDFKERGPGMFKRFAYSDENVDMLMEGLVKAGL